MADGAAEVWRLRQDTLKTARLVLACAAVQAAVDAVAYRFVEGRWGIHTTVVAVSAFEAGYAAALFTLGACVAIVLRRYADAAAGD